MTHGRRFLQVCRILVLACGLFAVRAASATTLTVPDDVPTVRAALDSLAVLQTEPNTVFIRSGLAPEDVDLNVPLEISLVGVADSPSLPVLGRIVVTDSRSGGSGTYQLNGLRLTRPAGVFIHWPIEFRDCVLDSNLSASAEFSFGVRAVRCSLQSVTSSRVTLVLDSCAVAGSIFMSEDEGIFSVRNCVVQGSVGTSQVIDCLISHNWVRQGISVNAQTGSQEILDNQTEGTIWVRGDAGATIARNSVHGGNVGIRAESFGPLTVQDNVVMGAGTGILLGLSGDGFISGNVVGHSSNLGFDVSVDCCGTVDIHHNTSYDNTGSGFWIHGPPSDGEPVPVHHNIAFRNGGHGLRTTLEPPPSLSCDDWFANDSSGVAGVEPGASDVAVDPLFCDVDHDSVSLSADSPLLDAPGCGLIGARGVGCSGTATLVERFEAVRVAEGVRLTWRVARGLPARLERASDVEGPWGAIAVESSSERDAIVALDRNAPADRTCWYRLVATIDGQDVAVASPILVPASSVLAFELRPVAPNPGRGPFTFEFTLAREAPVELDVFDVQGRLVRRAVHGTLAAGTHRASWNAEGSVPSGIYMVRYRHPDGEETRAFVRAR